MTAVATSATSARVGSGGWIIDSSIFVAVMTSLPACVARVDGVLLHERHPGDARLHAMSPRATMTPSVAAMISSRCS
jgi:hypothetical protein